MNEPSAEKICHDTHEGRVSHNADSGDLVMELPA